MAARRRFVPGCAFPAASAPWCTGARRRTSSGGGGPSSSGELPNGTASGAAAWPRLARLACTRNCLAAMDGSLALLPALEV